VLIKHYTIDRYPVVKHVI